MFNKSIPLVLQQETSECALACLTMILNFYGDKRTLLDIRSQSSSRGMNLHDLIEKADLCGMQARAIRIKLKDLKYLKFPAIIHWELKHFVVITKVSGNKVYINDPAIGKKIYSIEEVSSKFTGVVLEVFPKDSFNPITKKNKIQWREFFGNLTGIFNSVSKIFLLALALELLLLLSPFYMQSILDHVLVGQDKDLLNILSIAFLFLLILQALMYLLRSWSSRVLITSLGTIWEHRLFSRLLKLPMNFFESRSLGEILSRFSSIRIIQNVLAGSLIEVIMDGIMSFIALFIMLYYNSFLVVITLVSLTIYFTIRVSLFNKIRLRVESQYTALSKQESHTVETIRGVQTLKLFASEQKRLENWHNLMINTVNESLSLAWLDINIAVIKRFITGSERIIVIWYSVHLVLNQTFSVGMLIAYLAYREIFAGRASALIDRIMSFRLLKVHAERLTDIIDSEPERQNGLSFLEPINVIEIKKLSFRYAQNEPLIIKNLNLSINKNESIAIVGKSGCGKTTLLKLLTGLLNAEKGIISINGKNIKTINIQDYRKSCGVVMQDDQLFAGTIAQNIALFDSSIDMERVIDAAKKASIDNDIKKMIMQYNTLVGDMGSTFSGGQKQRILLARALYKKPEILLLDEATSHLDNKNEMFINQSVKKLSLICIVVAHRKETIAFADRVLVMENGMIIKDCKPSEYLK